MKKILCFPLILLLLFSGCSYSENNDRDVEDNIFEEYDLPDFLKKYYSEEFFYVVHEGYSSCPISDEKTRPYSRPITPEEYAAIYEGLEAALTAAIGCEKTDPHYRRVMFDYYACYATYKDKFYMYIPEEDYLKVLYENSRLGDICMYSNHTATIALYNQTGLEYYNTITEKGYRHYDIEAEKYLDDYVTWYWDLFDSIITIDLPSGKETVLEGRKTIIGDPYGEDGEFYPYGKENPYGPYYKGCETK